MHNMNPAVCVIFPFIYRENREADECDVEIN